jgi:hypothetical protein
MNTEIKTVRDLCTAFGAGKELMYRFDNGGLWSAVDSNNIGLLLTRFSKHIFRIKPDTEKVQLGPDDIDLHRDLFRFTVAPKKVYVATANGTDTVTINNHAYPFFALRDSVERSIDGGVTWQRCEKEAP